MKLVSWNVNGLRSIYGKGFVEWFNREKADYVCLQETKIQPDHLDSEALRHPARYHAFWHSAEKRGYSGVGIYAKREPHGVHEGLGIEEFDREGRVLRLDYPEFSLLNAYFPNSQRDHGRLEFKLRFCAALKAYVDRLRSQGRHVLICGDFNIAHREIDLRNPKQNLKNAGFLPSEREWMEHFTLAGWVDSFRQFHRDGGHYTWWSYRPGVRAKNIGWRLDYFFANEELKDRLKSAVHRCEVMGSDHCPVMLTLKR